MLAVLTWPYQSSGTGARDELLHLGESRLMKGAASIQSLIVEPTWEQFLAVASDDFSTTWWALLTNFFLSHCIIQVLCTVAVSSDVISRKKVMRVFWSPKFQWTKKEVLP
jgi:hypothetical protein